MRQRDDSSRSYTSCGSAVGVKGRARCHDGNTVFCQIAFSCHWAADRRDLFHAAHQPRYFWSLGLHAAGGGVGHSRPPPAPHAQSGNLVQRPGQWFRTMHDRHTEGLLPSKIARFGRRAHRRMGRRVHICGEFSPTSPQPQRLPMPESRGVHFHWRSSCVHSGSSRS